MDRFLSCLLIVGVSIQTQNLVAQTCPDNDGRGVTALADRVWQRRLESQITNVNRGFELAGSALPGRFQSINIEGTPEFSMTDRASHEYTGAATFSVELGSKTAALGALLKAQKGVFHAEKSVERWIFVEKVQDLYISWRTHELERSSLEEYVKETSAELKPLREARKLQLLSKLDLADFEVEVARIKAELVEATRRSSDSRARLFALLGMECEPAKVSQSDFPEENPWKSLLKKVEEFPQVKRLDSEDKMLVSLADLHRASTPWVINAGVSIHSTDETVYLGPVLSLTIPLQTNNAEAHLSDARSVAIRLERQQRVQNIKSELIAEGKNYDSLRAQYEALGKEFLAPLKKRAKYSEEAFKASQIQVDRLIRARQDLHEGEHMMLLKYAEIEAQVLKSIALERLLAEEKK